MKLPDPVPIGIEPLPNSRLSSPKLAMNNPYLDQRYWQSMQLGLQGACLWFQGWWLNQSYHHNCHNVDLSFS